MSSNRSITFYRLLQLAALFRSYLFRDNFILDYKAVTNSTGRWMFFCVDFHLQDYEYSLQLCSNISDCYGPSTFIVNETRSCERNQSGIVTCPLPSYDGDIYTRLLGWNGKENRTSGIRKVPYRFHCDWESVKPRITSVEPLNKEAMIRWKFQGTWSSPLEVKSTVFYSSRNSFYPRNVIHPLKCNKNTTNHITSHIEQESSHWKYPPKCTKVEQPNDETSHECRTTWITLDNACVENYTICVEFKSLKCDNSYVTCMVRSTEKEVIEAPQLDCSFTRNNVIMEWKTNSAGTGNEPYRYHYQLYQQGNLIKERTNHDVPFFAYHSNSNRNVRFSAKVMACKGCLCSKFAETTCTVPSSKPRSGIDLTVPVVSSVGATLFLICIVFLIYFHKTRKKRRAPRRQESNILEEADLYKNEQDETDCIYPAVYDEVDDKGFPHNYNDLANNRHRMSETWIDKDGNQQGFHYSFR